MTGRTLPGNQTESFRYDVNGNVIGHADFANKGTSYAYDSLNQAIQVKRADGATIVTAYTANGQVASTTVTAATTIGSNANAIQSGQTTYAYDAQDRVVKQSNPDGSFLAYAYDPNGNITQRSTAQGTVNYSYDSNQRLISVTDVNNQATHYSYDSNNRLATTTTPDGVTATYGYDANNRLLQVLHQSKTGTIVGGSAYTLATNGQRMQVQEFDNLSTVTNNAVGNPKTTTNYLYDGLNRLTEEKLTDRSNTVLSTIDYQYDAVGNRGQKTITTASGVETITYAYDVNDRLTQQTDTVGTTQTPTTFSWDANGNLQSKTAGNTTTFYLWDSQNHLVEADQGATQATATPIAKYTYDVNGNRVMKVEPGKVTTYRFDSNQANAQVVEEDVTQANVTTVTTYAWSNDGKLIGMNVNGQQRYPVMDAQGSVMALTDDSGNITDTWTYDAFGNQTSRTGATVNPFRYTSEYTDDTIGLQYNRARWYDPQVGRFISQDTFIGHLEQPISLNKYTYTNDNPVNGTDPSGKADLVSLSTTLTVANVLVTSYMATSYAMNGQYGYAATTVALSLVGVGIGAVRWAWAAEESWVGIGATGKLGEDFLRGMGGASQVGKETSLGWRYIDQLVNEVAHESKVGAASLTQAIQKQILKDMELLATGKIQGAVWHFFTSPVTGLGGPSGPLAAALTAAGITFVIH